MVDFYDMSSWRKAATEVMDDGEGSGMPVVDLMKRDYEEYDYEEERKSRTQSHARRINSDLKQIRRQL